MVASALVIGLSHRAAAEDAVPRTIIALYEGGDVENSYIHSVAEMPLNHLGLTVEYHDIHQPLPDIAKRKDVRGVITWFYGDTDMDPETYLKWMLAALDADKKYVIVGSLGVPEDARHYAMSALIDRALNKLGIKLSGFASDRPLDVVYEYKTPSMFLTPAPYDWIRPPYEGMQASGEQAQVHLIAHRPKAPPGEDCALIVTGPHGGYLDADYAIRSDRRSGYDTTQWMVNPFEFFRLAFATDDLPKPDPTTLGGRRIYYSNIDGDGWNNVTWIEQYRGKKVLSAEVILDKAIKAYPDLPVMVAPIAADIDPDWVGTEDSARVLRDIWAQPQVEPGSHTFSHPFYWMFFADGNVDKEIPYLHLYKTATWQPEGGIPENKDKLPLLPSDTIVPRAYANQPFDLHQEIQGSLESLAQYLPKGKKIDILAWSGDCTPWEEAVHLTREAHVQNINGGDSRFDPEYPSYASVAPVGKQVGKERQIYNSSSNEMTYTDLWEDNFHAFAYLKATLHNTEVPARLSAMSIYYHIYSGEREASLNALLSDLDYARSQDIAPVSVGHYTHIAEGFYDTELVALASDRWRVEQRGALETLRFDNSTLKAVDFDRSQGVIGERQYQGSLYIYLDPTVAQPIVALKNDNRYWAPPEENTAYLVESRWVVSNLTRGASRLDFTAQGYGAGDMTWQVPAPGVWRVSVNGKAHDIKVAADRMLKLHLENNALQPLHIAIAEAGNA
jgi:hypothetical protein